MPIAPDHFARGMDFAKSLRMSLDEVHLALTEAYADLTDEQFHAHVIAGRHNIVTIVMHLLQQLDEFNVLLQERSGVRTALGWRHFEHEERFRVGGKSFEEVSQADQPLPSVADVRAIHEALTTSVLRNLGALSSAELMAPDQHWPHLADRFFRALWHTQCHVRQIWLLRGALGLTAPFPAQHYA